MMISLFGPMVNPSQVFAATGFSGGMGTAGDPYIITTPEQLNSIRSYGSSYFKLGDNIDLTDYLSQTGAGYNGGNYWTPISYFSGTLDGDGYTIKGLKIKNNNNFIGFFGDLASGSYIKNIGLENVEINSSGMFVGGIAGAQRSQSTISNSYVTGDVKGGTYVGGLIGYQDTGAVIDSYSTAKVNASSQAGGLIGLEYRSSSKNSYAAGSITGSYPTGGLVGGTYSGADASVHVDTYYDREVSGQWDNSGKGEPKSTAEMKSRSTFLTWDLASAWFIKEGHYPELQVFLAETPTADVEGGPVAWKSEIALSSGTTNASIYYTTNGDEPTLNSTRYISPIVATEDMTIKAIAVKGTTYNEVMTESYTVIGKAEAPTTGSLLPGTDFDTTQLNGVTDVMEYKVNNGNYNAVSTDDTSVDNIAVQAGDTISVRIIEGPSDPASEVQVLTVGQANIHTRSTASTLTSTIGLVSTGGTPNETITNITYGTTLATFKGAITLAAGATFEVYEADGINPAVTLATGDKVIVTAQDTTMKTTYTVTMQEGPPAGMYLSPGTNVDTTRLNGVTDAMEYNVNNESYVAIATGDNSVDNISVQAGDEITVRTAATLDIPASIEQVLTVGPADIKAKSRVSTLTSTIGTVSTGGTSNETITNIPYGTTLAALKVAITPAADATFEVYEADGITPAGTLATGSKVIVTAQDTTTKTTYVVRVESETTPITPTTPTGQTPTPVPAPAPAPVPTPVPTPSEPEPTPVVSKPVYNDKVDKKVVADIKRKAESASSTTLSDVKMTSWSYDDIDYAIRAGIIKGYTDGSFRGETKVTRGEFAQMLVKALGLTATGTEVVADATGHFAEDAIRALLEKGIMTGYADGSFGPNREIKRAEIAALLARVLDLTQLNTNAKFEDINGSWAKDSINALGNAGIINGKKELEFTPNANASREESVVLIVRLLKLIPTE
ncbi:S-layer homology domain-containing protein [Paenibacillus sp. PCH8]|uniref:S-layer homology domain-containing protein n=1 Tax=Paenibacillus sp. PCH8 TaxID=2066524 RepID=UPI0015E32935|nr:S-layer homology domain-containing protein [Paenibacillus sp. PCH8]